MKYSVSMRLVTIVLVCLFFNGITAQEIHILDADSGEPVTNVVVYNHDRTRTAISGEDGNTNLGIFEAKERIYFSHLGYQTFRTTKALVLNRGNSVFMSPKSEQLDEVVMSVPDGNSKRKMSLKKLFPLRQRPLYLRHHKHRPTCCKTVGRYSYRKANLEGEAL